MSIIPNFLAGFMQKMYMTKKKLFNVTSVNFGFILNVTILIIQITDIFKTVMNPGITQNVAAQFSPSTRYQVTKASWFVVLVMGSDSNFMQLKELENDHNSVNASLFHYSVSIIE